MAVREIDRRLCVGCGCCVTACPADVLRIEAESGKAVPRYPQDCVVCCRCLADCPTGAIILDTEAPPLYFGAMG